MKIKFALSNFVYYMAIYIYMIFMTLTQTMFFNKFQGYKYLLVIFSILILVFIKEYISLLERKESIKNILILMAIIIISYAVGKESLSCTSVLVYTSRNVNINQIIKNVTYLLMIILIFIIISSKLNIIPNYSVLRGGNVRQYLGFRYSLYPTAILFNIVAGYIYVYKRKVKLSVLIFLSIFARYLYMCTYAKLSTVLVFAVILIAIFDKYMGILKIKFVNKIIYSFRYSYIILTILSVWIVSTYNQSVEWMNKLNILLESRISLAKQSVDMYGMNLFGIKDLAWQGNGLSLEGTEVKNIAYLYVDNFYINIIQQYGLIFSIILLIIFTLTIMKSLKEGDNYLGLILIIFAFHGLLDNLMMTLYYNIFLITLFPILSENAYGNDKKYKRQI
ncbi:hypothetical protein [Ligilactobacillus salivarius]|uniref:hypothetical protein n=1 Tax=Ligilactobacillus salivarius TaxID=1624 RepID=UPI002104A830|nr:hypothetical protein [Ligilactobacillus salivarius]UTX36515.1 hypothetical protein NNL28_07350 [Ligilactobacillus salivarius]